jgi:hypothetical protein
VKINGGSVMSAVAKSTGHALDLLDMDGRSYRIRTDFEGVAYQAFRAAGVQPPGRVTILT